MSVTDLLLKSVPQAERTTSPIRLTRIGRRDLPALTRQMGFTRGAEIGVWKGAFSAAFCQANPKLHMLCVDPWVSYTAWLDTKNNLPPREAAQFMAAAHAIAVETLKRCNCTIVRKFSIEAAKAVPDRSLDFAFIDGNHVFDAVMADLAAWMPKVKPGGWIGGHDFRKFSNKPTIHVVEAVEAFTKNHQIDPWFVLAAEPTPSFIWVVN